MAKQIGPNEWEFDSPAGPLRGQGTTEADAKLSAVNNYHKSLPLMGGSDSGKKKELDFVGKAKQWLLDTMPSGDEGLVTSAARATTETFAPGSLEELAVMAATGGAGKVAGVAGKAIPALAGAAGRAAAGVATPAIAGGLAGAVKGENPLPGMALGATAGGIGEATRLAFTGTGAGIEKLTRRWGNLEMKQYNERVRAQVGPTLARDINADIPSLKKAGIDVNGVPDVLKLLDDSTGRQVVGKMFDVVEDKIAKKIGTVELPRDVLEAAGRSDLVAQLEASAASKFNDQARLVAKQLGVAVNDPMVTKVLGQAGIAPGQATATVSVPGRDAIDIAKQLRHQGLRRGEGLQGRPPRAMAEDVQSRVDNALGNDTLKAEYAQLRDDYSKFMDLRDWLNKNDPSKLFPGMVSKGGATIDLVGFGNAMVKDIADLPPSRFPNLHRTMTGEGSGTRAVESSGSALGSHMGIGIPGTHIRAYPSVSKKTPPDLPASISVGGAPPGGIRRVGGIAAGLSRVGTAAGVPTMNE